ncbi:MAG TPA: PspC domain-containing protein, partial [Bryobacteraceae bacterium]|nr:PspC domain-containing protein [Bryobacteraceae bacterium]
QAAPRAQPRLSRPHEGRKIAGVCAGIARYLDVDPVLVRIIAVILLFVPPCPALLGYIVAWIIMPNDPLVVPAAQPYHA